MFLFDAFDRRSVAINGVYCPFQSVPGALKRFCRPALFFNEGAAFEASYSGSAVLIRYRERNFAVFTRHQLGQTGPALGRREAGSFVIVAADSRGKQVGMTASSGFHPLANDQFETLGDLTILEYDEARFAGKHGVEFFELGTVAPSADAIVNIAIGFPSYGVEIDVSEEGVLRKMNMASATLFLDDADVEPLDPEHRRMMIQHSRTYQTLADPDGMSGAPVFSVRLNMEGLVCTLAGIITHARLRRFAVLSEEPLRKALDSWFSSAG